MNYLFDDITLDNMLKKPFELEDKAADEICLDFSDVNWVEPFGMLYAGMLIKQFYKDHPGYKYDVKYDKEADAFSYAGHMGFFKFIFENIPVGKAPGMASGSENYMPITKINFEDERKRAIDEGIFQPMGEIIETKSGALARVIAHGNKELEILLSYCIREMLRNTAEHSSSDNAWICGQYWPKKDRAEIAIVDEGIGLKGSLANNNFHKDYIKDDKDALTFAIKPGISKAFDPKTKNKNSNVWSNSGFGLFMTSEICKKLGGKFYLTSGSKALEISKKGEKFYDTDYKGVAICIQLPTKLTSAQKIIIETSSEGEDKAKSIRNSFKQASKASKGLL